MEVSCKLSQIRRKRGVSVAALAKRVGTQRQTIYSLEQGTYLPNTALALRLARELDVQVEDLFSLVSLPETGSALRAKVIATGPVGAGAAVALAQCDGQWLAVPQDSTHCYLPDADGVVSRSGRFAEVKLAGDTDVASRSLLVAGCDPALSLLASEMLQVARVRMLPSPVCSETALEWLRLRLVHVAGCHLEDYSTGEFNVQALRRKLPDDDVLAVTFAEWEQGFVVAPGNPMGVREVGDLANSKIRFINRETGSGSRALLTSFLKAAGLPLRSLNGHQTVVRSHMAVARAVLEGRADCGIATSSAARALQLDFVPLRRERFDLVLRKESLNLPVVAALLECVPRQSLRRKLESLAGYDTSHSGSTVVA